MRIHLKKAHIEKTLTDEVSWTTNRFTWGEGFQEIDHRETTYTHIEEISVYVDNVDTYQSLGGKTGVIEVTEDGEQAEEKTFEKHSGLPRLIPNQPQVHLSGQPDKKITNYMVHERTEDLGTTYDHYNRVIRLEDCADGLQPVLTIRRKYTTVEEERW